MFIELACPFVLGVNGNRADASNVGDLKDALDGIAEKSASQAFSLPGSVYRKAGEKNDGDRVTRQPLA